MPGLCFVHARGAGGFRHATSTQVQPGKRQERFNTLQSTLGIRCDSDVCPVACVATRFVCGWNQDRRRLCLYVAPAQGDSRSGYSERYTSWVPGSTK